MRSCCILVAAGSGTRLGRGPKAFLGIAGRSLLDRALQGVLEAGVDEVVVVLPPGSSLADGLPGVPANVTGVTGGSTRQESVVKGLAAMSPDVRVVLVHDAARCLTPPTVIRRVIDAVEHGAPAVIPGLVVTDTLRWSDGTMESAPDRDRLVAVQTPQGFDRSVIVAAHEAAAQVGVEATDDAILAERLGHQVQIVAGDEISFKVTRPVDLVLAEALCARSN